jgi:hypothetical protein
MPEPSPPRRRPSEQSHLHGRGFVQTCCDRDSQNPRILIDGRQRAGTATYSAVHLAILYEIRTGCSQAAGGNVQSCTHRRHLHRSTRRSASARSLNASSIDTRSLPTVRRARGGPSSISRCWLPWAGVIGCSRAVGRAVTCVGRWGRSSYGFRCRRGKVLQATAVHGHR